MTIREYVEAVKEQLTLPPKTWEKFARQLENELYEMVEAGLSQQEATEKMGPPAELAQQLRERAGAAQKLQQKPGEMPLLLPWAVIFSATLMLVKGVMWLGSHTMGDATLALLGLVLTVISGVAALRYRKPKKEQQDTEE